MEDTKRRLVYSIVEFLKDEIKGGTVSDTESLEVAIQCIGSSFGVDLEDEQKVSTNSIKPATLTSIFDVFLKTQDKLKGTTSSGTSSSTTNVPVEKTTAEDLKSKGNAAMAQKSYDEAIKYYSDAISIDSSNAVYYANRAAAHSQKGDHEMAVQDAKKATEMNPSYSKAYSRLGHAHFALGQYTEAVVAYENGLSFDPNNTTMQTSLTTAKQKAESISESRNTSTGSNSNPGSGSGGLPDLSSLMGSLGGGAGGGGVPDIAGMLRNPQMMAMAQQMMQSGALDGILNNPRMRDMANQYMSSGQLPNPGELMNDPTLADLARNLGGGGPPPPNSS